MLKMIKNRKPKFLSYDGLIASLHILTFPSKFKDKNEQGVSAANKVNGHYFYYGIPGEEFFDIDIVQENNVMIEDDSTPFSLSRDEEEKDEIYQAFEESEENDQMTYSSKLTRNGSSIVEKCYFPAVFEDPLLCLSLWNLWHSIGIIKKPTIAFLYDYHLRTSLNYSVYSNQSVPDSFSLELLAQWAIAYASHLKFSGKTGSFSVLKLFFLNIQSLKDTENFKKMINSLDNLQLPQNLNDFLSRVEIPYLVNGPPKKSLIGHTDRDINPNMKASESEEANGIESKKIAELSRDLSPFIKFGTCHRPLNSAGWDVLFDMKVDGVDEIGYIECKLWTDSVRLPQIYPYYKKARVNGIKFSILLAKNIQNSLHKPKRAKKIKIDT
jgi:hypothetical protein